MPLQYDTVINASYQPHKLTGIAGLVIELLSLEKRLSAQNDQSGYFRMAIESHTNQLAGLRVEYERIRDQFNQHNPSHFRDEISAQEQRIQANAKLSPLIARAMVKSRAERIIQEMQEMIDLKKRIDQLPTIDRLKLMPQLLEALLEIK